MGNGSGCWGKKRVRAREATAAARTYSKLIKKRNVFQPLLWAARDSMCWRWRRLPSHGGYECVDTSESQHEIERRRKKEKCVISPISDFQSSHPSVGTLHTSDHTRPWGSADGDEGEEEDENQRNFRLSKSKFKNFIFCTLMRDVWDTPK